MHARLARQQVLDIRVARPLSSCTLSLGLILLSSMCDMPCVGNGNGDVNGIWIRFRSSASVGQSTRYAEVKVQDVTSTMLRFAEHHRPTNTIKKFKD